MLLSQVFDSEVLANENNSSEFCVSRKMAHTREWPGFRRRRRWRSWTCRTGSLGFLAWSFGLQIVMWVWLLVSGGV